MAETRKVLGQSNPAATTLTPLYTVPALTQAVISTITVCNQDASDITFSLSIAVAGAADDPEQYILKDYPLSANNGFPLTEGYTLGAGDVVRCKSSSSTTAFQVFGVEIT